MAAIAALRLPQLECALCATPIPPSRHPPSRLPLLPCGHIHCLSCLRRNFQVSLASMPFRPARCCDAAAYITLPLLRACLHLSSHEAHAYREKLAEYDARDKVYCSDPRCSAFIPPALRDGRVGRCRVCRKKTCLRCRGLGHFGGCDDGGGGDELAPVVVSIGGGEGPAGLRNGQGQIGSGSGNGQRKEVARPKKKPKLSNDERFRRLSKEMGWFVPSPRPLSLCLL